MYREKILALPESDREILDQIGAGEESGHADTVCKRLEKQGLIIKLGMKTIGRGCFGPIQVPVYEMPIAVAIRSASRLLLGGEI
jgi:hypothetical protein